MASRKKTTRARPLLAFTPSLGATPVLPDTPVVPDTDVLPDTPVLGGTRVLRSLSMVGHLATGDMLLDIGRRHLGEKYVFGARAPMADPNWTGPWDCAEFVSWCVFQASGVLYGTEPRDNPMLADAFTGFWVQQARAGGHTISVEEAAGIAGAAVVRMPRTGLIGHIVFSDGRGGTVEAHSRERGVIEGTLSGRRWDMGVLVPGIEYLRGEAPVIVKPAPDVLRLTDPLTRGETVKKLQRRLAELGFAPGTADGIYGPQTAHAVRLFQASKGLVADGEAGPATLKALKLK